VEATSAEAPVETSAASTDPIETATTDHGDHGSQGVEVTSTMVHIHGVSTERPSVVKYLEGIAPGKQEIALIHALEVGITELLARRARFRPTTQ
jgi:hypothetical protein